MVVVVPDPTDAAPVFPIPDFIPTDANPLNLLGRLEHNTWGKVWGIIKGEVDIGTNLLNAVEDLVASAVTQAVDTMGGTIVSYLAGIIDDVAAYAQGGIDFVFDGLNDTVYGIDRAIIGIEDAFWALGGVVAGIEAETIPDIYRRVVGIERAIPAWSLGAFERANQWAIDNIRTPLDAEVEAVAGAIPVWAEGAYERAKAYTDDLVHNEALRRAAAIAGIAAAVAEATTWIDDCGEPMCQTLGPKTDLGKWLKALKVAEWIALLAYLQGLDEAKIEALLRTLAAGAEGVFDELGAVFTGTGTLGDII